MKKFFGIFFLLSISLNLYGQEKKQDEPKKEAWKAYKEKIYIGGNMGLQFGNPTLINVSPIIGYRITNKFSVGTGFTYTYFRVKYLNPNVIFSTSLYGGSLFTRYQILDNVFLHLENEALNGEYYDNITGETGRRWVNSTMIGGGFVQPIGNGGFTIMGLYILNYNPYTSFYPSPFILRMGFFF